MKDKHCIVIVVERFDMVDVKNNKCITCNAVRATCNYQNRNKALYCKDC